jgi:hypothetical protein
MKSPLFLLPLLASLAVALAQSPAPSSAPAAPATESATPAATPATTPAPKATPAPQAGPALDWYDVTKWGVEGREFTDMERGRWFDRLPAEAEKKVSVPVWNLSHDSAGMVVRFQTNATSIWAQYRLMNPRLGMPHMPPTGVSGVDLYARDEKGKWRWVNVTKPAALDVKMEIQGGLMPGEREYAAYLPLYNGMESLYIGVPKGSKFDGLAPREKPMVFYGTSITHGACASRPGMVHTAILGRQFDRPVVNFGFSGNGRMDAAVGDYLAKIDASVFIIDCLPNMGPADVRAKCPPLVKKLRAARPEVPIVLVEDRKMTNTWIRPERQKFHAENHAALRESFEALKKDGITKLYYIPGDDLLGDDSEGATDGSHPSDLGFMRQAAVFAPVLREALGGK